MEPGKGFPNPRVGGTPLSPLRVRRDERLIMWKGEGLIHCTRNSLFNYYRFFNVFDSHYTELSQSAGNKTEW